MYNKELFRTIHSIRGLNLAPVQLLNENNYTNGCVFENYVTHSVASVNYSRPSGLRAAFQTGERGREFMSGK